MLWQQRRMKMQRPVAPNIKLNLSIFNSDFFGFVIATRIAYGRNNAITIGEELEKEKRKRRKNEERLKENGC